MYAVCYRDYRRKSWTPGKISEAHDLGKIPRPCRMNRELRSEGIITC
jgi:hypothetical protein